MARTSDVPSTPAVHLFGLHKPKGGFFNGLLTHPLRLPPEHLSDPDFPPVDDTDPVGKCSHRLTDDQALARIKDPTAIKYPWYGHDTLTSIDTPGQRTGVDRLLSSLALSANEEGYQRLLVQVRRDHELFRISMTANGYDLPSSPSELVQVGGKPAFTSGPATTHDPCNGFMWYHPAIPIGFALGGVDGAITGVKATPINIRSLGFSTAVQWGAAGSWAGDMMHFDFDSSRPPVR